MTEILTPQAEDFREQSEALFDLLQPLPEEDFERSTAFKDWTLNTILRHLHVWNYAAELSLRDGDAFAQWIREPAKYIEKNELPVFEEKFLNGLKGHSLLQEWRRVVHEIADRFSQTPPKQRVAWAGPDMSVRSSITARLMETWAHGQAVYDLLGVVRQNTDSIRNIVILGVNTYGWAFKNRGLDVPDLMPFLCLRAPSGEMWCFGEETNHERIDGSAEAFCQVVTQTRNIADVDLTVVGSNAKLWMEIAQCFAGPPETPPAPGQRKTNPNPY